MPLILTRNSAPGKNEIIIDGDITITFLDIQGGQARVEIDAPKSTNIRRGELQPETKGNIKKWK